MYSGVDLIPLLGIASIWSAIYRREYLLTHAIKVDETQGASYQDLKFALQAYFFAPKLYVIKGALLNYRQEAGMDSSTMVNDARFLRTLTAYESAIDFLLLNNATQAYKNHVFALLVMMSYFHYLKIQGAFKNDYLNAFYNLSLRMKMEHFDPSLLPKAIRRIFQALLEKNFLKFKFYALYYYPFKSAIHQALKSFFYIR